MTRIWTVGHSVHPIETFFEILATADIQVLVDVRRYPVSRRNPQFHSVELKKSCFHHKIEYVWMGDELGGHREPAPTSPHIGLSNAAFRGYADWTASPTFRFGVERLLAMAEKRRVVYMCAERPTSNCHRQLLSDYLVLVHGAEVVNLFDVETAKSYQATPGVRRSGEGVLYLAPEKKGVRLDEFVQSDL